MTKLILEGDSGVQVDTEQFSKSALGRIASSSYDAIISDYQMPGMDGIELLKALRASGDHTPFILFTGRGREEVAIEALNNGADFYLQKGGNVKVQFAELKNAVVQLAQRRTAEMKVAQGESQYHDLVEGANSIILKIDTEGNILFLNSYGMRFFGVTGDVVGKPALGGLVRPEDYPGLSMDQFLIDFTSKELDSVNYTLPVKRGTGEAWVSLTVKAVRDPRRVIREFLLIGNDITEVKKVEIKLQHSNSVLRATLDSSDEGILVVNNDRTVSDYNRQFLDLWKVPPSLIETGDGRLLIEHKLDQLEDPDHFVRYVEDCYACPGRDSSCLLELKDGRVFEVYSTPERNGQEIVGRYWSFKDITERNESKKRLEAAELRHKNILNGISEGIFALDVNNRIAYANQPMSDMLGVPLDRIIGANPLDFVCDESKASAISNLAARRAGSRLRVDYKLKRGDGTEFWATESGNPIFNNGRYEGTIYAMRDVTEIKRTETALRQSEERFRYLIERSPHAIVIVRDSRCTYANSCCARMLEYGSTDEIMGRSVAELFSPKCHQLIKDTVSPGEQDRLPSPEHECIMLKKNGDALAVSLSRTRVELSDGLAVVLVIDDISGRKRIEEAFREKEHFMERVLSTDPSGILVYDIALDRVVYVNDQVGKVTGRSLDEIRGMAHGLASMVHPDDKRTLMDAHREIVNGKDDEVREIEVRIVGKHNEWRWVHFYGTPFMRDKAGKVIQTISGMMDITDRKGAEDRARKALGKLEILAGITNHDISNQVMAISGNVELARRLTEEPEVLDRLERIGRSSRTISSQIEFARNYQNMGSMPPSWQNLEHLVQDLDVRGELAGLELSETVRGLSIFADQMLKNVIYNLLEDSLKYADRPTTVGLSCSLVDGDLKLVYEDVGPGILAQDKGRIFEKGYGKGTGFGLFLSREVLAITGIRIEENGEPGKGARFEMTIPQGGFQLGGQTMALCPGSDAGQIPE